MDIYNGMEFTNSKGFKWRVIDCRFSRRIVIESLEWMPYTVTVRKESIQKGVVFYPYGKMKDGCYRGEGVWDNSTRNPYSGVWCGLRTRTLDETFKNKHKAYLNCTLSPEWVCLQNFCDWADSTYPKDFPEIPWELDKDLLSSSGVYSPETCCWLPKEINLFLSKKSEKGIYEKKGKRGSSFALFVREGTEVYKEKNGHYIGSYPTYEDAVVKWKEVEQNRLNTLIEKYRYCLSPVVIEKLISLEIV